MFYYLSYEPNLCSSTVYFLPVLSIIHFLKDLRAKRFWKIFFSNLYHLYFQHQLIPFIDANCSCCNLFFLSTSDKNCIDFYAIVKITSKNKILYVTSQKIS